MVDEMGVAMKNALNETQKRRLKDQIRGSLVGGAAGDALGYTVEFLSEGQIFRMYGDHGITEYALVNGKALISDDTQMTLFTAAGLLLGDTRCALRGIMGAPSYYVALAYTDWYLTQTRRISDVQNDDSHYTWLLDVPELFSRRAPGTTCMSYISKDRAGVDDYIKNQANNSKGCGGIMRVAPMALLYNNRNIIEDTDMEAAQIAAITHGHPLGYIPAMVLNHIIYLILDAEKNMSLKDIVIDAIDAACRMFAEDKYIDELTELINLAIELSENNESDLKNIRMLGEGWVAEETLAIAVYCALKYKNDFSKAIIASVNHNGDSDSTGAVTGNIVGALVGYDAIESKWKEDLELHDVILEIADDLDQGCLLSEYGSYRDPAWESKYCYMHRYTTE